MPRPIASKAVSIAVLVLALAGSRVTLAAPPTVGSNKRIASSTTTDVAAVSLARDPVSGTLHAMLRHYGGNLTLYRSDNAGESWLVSVGLSIESNAAELAIVGGHGYLCAESYGDLQVRRFSAATGDYDIPYGIRYLLEDPPSPIVEVAALANGDDDADLVFCAALLASGVIRFYTAPAAAGTPFIENSPGVSDADSGLALAWRMGASSGAPDTLALSYVSTLDQIWVHRLDEGGWDGGEIVVASAPAAEETTLAAFDDNLFLAYEKNGLHGQDVWYRTSPNRGEDWYGGAVSATPPTGGEFFAPLASARSGTGNAVLVQHEGSPIDTLELVEQRNYGSASWSDPVKLNDYDFGTNWEGFDLEWLGAGWGVAYRDNSSRAWFLLSRAIRYAGFESGDLSEWSEAVGGP